jgi:hypothetical protein
MAIAKSSHRLCFRFLIFTQFKSFNERRVTNPYNELRKTSLSTLERWRRPRCCSTPLHVSEKSASLLLRAPYSRASATSMNVLSAPIFETDSIYSLPKLTIIILRVLLGEVKVMTSASTRGSMSAWSSAASLFNTLSYVNAYRAPCLRTVL